MMHVVTAANRSLYERQIEEMHRLRWKYYIEERGWRELREMQPVPGRESDAYDDEFAVYLLGLDDSGSVIGMVRLRPTHDKCLLIDRFRHLLDEPDKFEPSPHTWEVTRIMRKAENRGQDTKLRFSTNAAMIEVALSRGVTKLVAGGDLFFLPRSRQLWRHKFRILGLPTTYEEGEYFAGEIDVDEETLRMAREVGGFVTPQAFEIPAPVAGRAHDIVLEERVTELLALLPVEQIKEAHEWLTARTEPSRTDSERTA